MPEASSKLLGTIGKDSDEARKLCLEMDFDYDQFKANGISDQDIIAYISARKTTADKSTSGKQTQNISLDLNRLYDVGKSLFSEGSSSTAAGESSASGSGAGSILGIVAAAIAAQHLMSGATDREFEGVKTKDAFSGHYATEPWLAYLGDKLGLDVSPGEKFDAALANKDYGLAAKRFPEAGNQWANPVQALGYGLNKRWFGNDIANVMDPASYLFSLISNL